jgi:cation/acetate symporter
VRTAAEDSDELTSNLGKIYVIFALGLIAVVVLLAILEQLGASASALIIGFVLVSIAIYGLISLLANTGDPVTFNVASRSVPAVWNGMATAATLFSATAFIGLAGTLFVLGFDGFAYLIGPLAGLLLAGLLIAPYL